LRNAVDRTISYSPGSRNLRRCAGALRNAGISAEIVEASSFDAGLMGPALPSRISVEVSADDLQAAQDILGDDATEMTREKSGNSPWETDLRFEDRIGVGGRPLRYFRLRTSQFKRSVSEQ
jgi:hypothetical protein